MNLSSITCRSSAFNLMIGELDQSIPVRTDGKLSFSRTDPHQ